MYKRQAYCSVKKFYKQFYYLNEVLFVLMMSLLIMYCVMISSLFLHCLVVFTMTVHAIPVALCLCIQRELESIQTLLSKFYWINNFQNSTPNTAEIRQLLWECVHKDNKFDCGYFKVDISLLLIIFNFITLFIFTIIP